MLVVALVVVPSAVAIGQALERPSVPSMRLDADAVIVLDGRLDEPFWDHALPATDFRQQNPVEGEAATQRTEVRVVYDASALYIGAMLFDDQPERIISYTRRRNAFPFTDDRFMLILDTFGDGHSGYYFEVTPAGMMTDGLVTTGQGGGLDRSWDGIWDARVVRTPDGWSVEMRIPFRTLNFDPEASVWGINFQRTIRRNHEDVLWAGHRRNQGLYRLQHAGRLHGLSGMTQGIGLEVKPYAVAGRRHVSGLDPARTADAGLDLTYSITPNLRSSLTINTDFAEVEVDARRVNLTRFPLRFPEQRDFFLEGSHIFRFAPASDIEPYFSRRIGLVAGAPVPIQVGARVAGQVGRTDVGVLQIRTGSSELSGEVAVPAEDFTIARFRHRILTESTLGIIYTRRASSAIADLPEIGDRHTMGTDLELNTSRFLGNRNLQFQSFFVWHNDGVGLDTLSWFDRTARGVRLSYPNNPWAWHVSYREFGALFDPAVGFVWRRAFRRLQPSISYRPSFESSDLIRDINFAASLEYLTDLDFNPETIATTFQLFDILFETGDELRLQFGHGTEQLPFDFDIRRDGSIIIPLGRYSGWGWSIRGLTTGRRPVSARAEYGRESFWTGTRDQYQYRLSYRTQVGLQLHADYSINDVRLAEGSFSTRLLQFAAEIDPTPRMSLTTNVQYDNLSELVGFYGRFRWIIRPGSDLYLVYTRNWLNTDDRWLTLEQAATTKLTYTHWF